MEKKIALISILVFIFGQVLFSQSHNKEEHQDSGDDKLGLEMVVSALFMHGTSSNETDFATELHLTYWTSHKWAFGVGYTLIFEEEETAHEWATLASHKPWKFLTVNAGPSFSLPTSHTDTEVSAYLESEFAFHVGEIHFGPTAGMLVGEEFRYFGGAHISYEF